VTTLSSAVSGPGLRAQFLEQLVERFRWLQIAAYNAIVYKRRVAAKGAYGGAKPVTRPGGPPVTGGVPAGVSRPPVNGIAPADAGRPPVNEGAASDSRSRSSEIFVLMAAQMQMRVLLKTVTPSSSTESV
jgi:hypothetical protein